ncbi:MAG: type I DNA topoisomerase [Gemmatimonadaceae bacterium]
MKTLVIVESPNKAKKLSAFLGPGYRVMASFGHVADLPPKEYGVDTATLEESYVVRNAKVVKELRDALKSGGYERVLLASDPDREGEAIAWHLARQLKLGARQANRIEFREVTAAAVRAAVASPRPVDAKRVDAQRSRRVLDRIVGFDCSREICWPAGAQSAGRCQTPALHILCEREREILAFVARTYFTVSATYAEGLTAFVPADPDEQEKQRAEAEASDVPESAEQKGRLRPKQFATREEADAVLAVARQHAHVVRGSETRRAERRPPPPYTTSTLQQDASRKLRLSAKAAMAQAQALFEAGMITYHRTDSTRVSDEAADMARETIGRERPEALPKQAPRSRTKAGAQDAHEAVRPTKLEHEDTPPAGTEKLYAMIRARFLASQCKPAVFDRTTVWIDSGPVAWVAEGSVMIEAGFLAYWGPYSRQEDTILPALRAGQALGVTDLAVEEKKTSPPPRYDQGALIKKLESSGIGRPATFAGIIATLLERDYAREISAGRGKQVLQPTEFGMQVDGLMSHALPELVTEHYTAAMETQLDEIERGNQTRHEYLTAWYRDFRLAMGRAEGLGAAYRAEHGLRSRYTRGGAGDGASRGEETKIRCDRCGEASYRKLERRGGKGTFLACPACRMMRSVRAKTKPGACPKCGSNLIEKKFGKGAAFWGCVRYGAAERPCDYRERSDGAVAGRYTRATTDKQCPKCGREKLVILTPTSPQMGAAFYACESRECGFTLPLGARRRRDPCPQCGGVVLERRRKPSAEGQPGEPFWSCAKYPECRYSAGRAAEHRPGA